MQYRLYKINQAITQRGNVLFLILIAVALFAILSYAVTSSSRSGNSSLSDEKAQIIASDLMQYGSELSTGWLRMRMSGVPDWQVDFYKNTPSETSAPTDLNASCTNLKCVFFHPEGGKVIRRSTYVDPDFVYSGYPAFYSVAVQNIGTSSPDLVWFKGGLTKSICQYINYKAGVYTTLATTPPNDTHSGATRFAGTLTAFPTSTKTFGLSTNTVFAGKHDFCYYHSAHHWVYIHVISAY